MDAFVNTNYVKWRGGNDRSTIRNQIGLHIAELENFMVKHKITPDNVDSESQHKVGISVNGETLRVGGRMRGINDIRN